MRLDLYVKWGSKMFAVLPLFAQAYPVFTYVLVI